MENEEVDNVVPVSNNYREVLDNDEEQLLLDNQEIVFQIEEIEELNIDIPNLEDNTNKRKNIEENNEPSKRSRIVSTATPIKTLQKSLTQSNVFEKEFGKNIPCTPGQ